MFTASLNLKISFLKLEYILGCPKYRLTCFTLTGKTNVWELESAEREKDSPEETKE